jgi:hypothetical protein
MVRVRKPEMLFTGIAKYLEALINRRLLMQIKDSER